MSTCIASSAVDICIMVQQVNKQSLAIMSKLLQKATLKNILPDSYEQNYIQHNLSMTSAVFTVMLTASI